MKNIEQIILAYESAKATLKEQYTSRYAKASTIKEMTELNEWCSGCEQEILNDYIKKMMA